MLKFENAANVGDVIKAYDFKPMAGRPDMFLTGRILAKGSMYKELENGHKAYIGEGYTVQVIGGDAESVEMGRIGIEMYVPYEVDFGEFDERVQVVVTNEEFELVMMNEYEEVMH